MRRKRQHDLPIDGDTETVAGEVFTFDEKAARRACDFFPTYLVHTKGPRALVGKPVTLAPWEHRLIWTVFGWRRADGTRRYRSAFVGIARKNGKSTLGAGLALLLLCADDEMGAEIYGAAANRDQARVIWDIAAGMVLRSPELRRLLDVLPSSKTIKFRDEHAYGMGFYRAIPADAKGALGFNAHGVIVDELLTQPDRELVDALTTSVGARTQPLTFFFTTAGFDRKSICGEEWGRADSLIRGVTVDPSHYAVIYAADPKDDFRAEETWKKANPGWEYMGDQFRDHIRGEAEKAALMPSFENRFRQYYCNQWVTQQTRAIPMTTWDAQAGIVVPAELKGRVCYGGLDLSATTDLTALTLVFPPKDGDPEDNAVYDLLVYYWAPEEGISRRSRVDHVPYEVWAREGFIRTLPGAAIDTRRVRDDILALAKEFNIREIAYDRWGARQIASELAEEGLEVIDFGQGFNSMNGPTQDFMRYVLSGRLRHGGHPVLRWNVDNLVLSQNPAGWLKPDKAKSTEKIDGAVTTIMALGRAVANRSTGAPRIRFIA